MKLSARNQIEGTVVNVNEGAVNAIVALEFAGETISGTISMSAVQELGLEKGKKATAIIKATEVMIGIGDLTLSARNKLAGKITAIDEGAVNAIVKVEVAGGNTISATISMASVKDLGLAVGKEVVAVIKATSVMFAI
ncbi:TOBE domain-containing protein [Eubacterium oxidoreducens]|uniref:Molybdate transport system regulatory protein n=1 Tax=Eubacterium oxidoreducens TaxID=1732 RepID=A0A1G6A6V7_EUBOX|nr:TOBE domain-containing protein [Eubacterium oxidoreducens]SDB04154.1 molybdate transport system regulatory protein [Eubacterium oxidoreducens]